MIEVRDATLDRQKEQLEILDMLSREYDFSRSLFQKIKMNIMFNKL